MVLINKIILSTYNFSYANVLLLDQCVLSLSIVVCARTLGLITCDPIEASKVRAWIPLNIFFLVMLVTGFFSLKYLSVPMVLVFKNANNALVTLGDWLFFAQPVSFLVILSLVVLIIASVLAASEDLEFTVAGYAWSIFNMVASSAYLLYLRYAMKTIRLSKVGMTYYNNVLGIPLVLIVDTLTTQDVLRFWRTDQISVLTGDYVFFSLFIASGVIGLGLNLASFLCLSATSPTTYSMVGALNKVPLAFLGVYLFNSQLTVKGSLYVTLSIAAGALYGLAKVRESAL